MRTSPGLAGERGTTVQLPASRVRSYQTELGRSACPVDVEIPGELVIPAVLVVVRRGHRLIIVLGVHHERQGQLLQVRLAACLPCFFPRLGKHGKECCCEDSDDRYHYEQFDQCETLLFHHLLFSLC